MSARRTLLASLSIAAVAVAACGRDGGAELEAGTYSITAALDPEPAAVGRNTMVVTVRDAAGAPVDAAALTLDPQMPAHGHGSNETPLVQAQGGGVYRAFPVTFAMPGRWEVSVTASTDAGFGTRVFVYDVP